MKERYTARSFRIALRYYNATVNCAINLYCMPYVRSAFSFKSSGRYYFLISF